MTAQLTLGRCSACAAILAAVFIAAGPKEKQKVQRYGMVIGVKPEKLDHYKQLHANPWPVVNKTLTEAHVRNYSIYLTQFDDGKWYLFGYLEYTGNDFKADMQKVADHDEVKRWWKETDPCQIPLKTRKTGELWKGMQEVYHLD